MGSGDIEDLLLALIQRRTELSESEIRGANALQEIGLDSLDMMEFKFEIEESLDVDIPYARYGEIASLDELCALVKALYEAKP